MANSTRARSGAKHGKPSFPLGLHRGSGLWTKKIRGRCYYFGKDKDAALAEYLRVRTDLEAGRRPPPADGKGLTLVSLCNAFLTHKQSQLKTGELGGRTFREYYLSCERMLAHLGKGKVVEHLRPEDLLAYRRKLAETLNANSLRVEIGRIRVLLRFAFDSGLVNQPIRLAGFKQPTKAAVRRERAAAGPRMFEAGELRAILAAATGQLRAMILLGANCGFGNMDCAKLPIAALDLDGGWIDYPRPKTGIPRRCPLWPETVQALREVLAVRKAPKDEQYAGLVFLTRKGRPWYEKDKPSAAVGHEFGKLLDGLGLRRPGVNFYALRHGFETVAGESLDQVGVNAIMGHVDSSMAAVYRERISDQRLRAVVNHVRAWLWPEGGAA